MAEKNKNIFPKCLENKVPFVLSIVIENIIEQNDKLKKN